MSNSSDDDHTSSSSSHSYQPTSQNFIPRYNGPSSPSEMTTDQLSIYNSIIQSRPRTGISGPFGPWLAVPNIAEPAQRLGKACRYNTSLSFRESELVILLTAARKKSHAEFDIHVGEALLAGLDEEFISAIPRDDDFSLEQVKARLLPLIHEEREKAIVRFAAELLETSTVSEDTYHATRKELDGKDSVLVEITSIIGYYTFVAYTLNVFRIPAKPSK